MNAVLTELARILNTIPPEVLKVIVSLYHRINEEEESCDKSS